MRPLELAHVALEVPDPDAWADFAERVLGLVVTDGGRALRLDDRPQRIVLERGPADDLAALGWRLPDDDALDALAARLRADGVEVVEAAPDVAAARGARRLLRCVDPAGVPVELVTQDEVHVPFASRRVPGGFVAGPLGFGHCAIRSDVRGASERFYRELLGLRLSDRIVADAGPYHLDLAFLGTNGRHHSVALAGPLPGRMEHLMLQLATLDDLGRAYDRATKAGVVATTFGRHPNDRMVSFYVRTPSRFRVEIGWGGVDVDEAAWTPVTHDRWALWGHHQVDPPRGLA